MSNLAEMVGRTRTDLIPGHTLSEPTIDEIAAAESEFERRALERARRAADGRPEAEAREIIKAEMGLIRGGYYTSGMPGFDALALSAEGLKLLAWLCLKVAHRDITRERAVELYKAAPMPATRNAVYEFWGWGKAEPADDGEKKGEANPGGGGSESPSTGPQSSTSSGGPASAAAPG
jgi:hypothetical protein